MKPCGVKYNNVFCALSYDKHHRKFRDYEKEANEIIAILGLDNNQTVIDIGCGTGAFVIHASKNCKKVYAVDVSKAMLRCARRKAKKAGIDNLEFHHGGFLTYKHSAEPVDAIVSTLALHHLPDFWKLVALKRAQIRHSALEAARIATNRVLLEKLTNDYLLQIRPYPHIILRENKMIFGAHADRLQQGMRRSFGKAIGTAARVEPDQTIITVKVKANAVETAKASLKRGRAKLPIPCKITVEKIKAPDLADKAEMEKI